MVGAVSTRWPVHCRSQAHRRQEVAREHTQSYSCSCSSWVQPPSHLPKCCCPCLVEPPSSSLGAELALQRCVIGGCCPAISHGSSPHFLCLCCLYRPWTWNTPSRASALVSLPFTDTAYCCDSTKVRCSGMLACGMWHVACGVWMCGCVPVFLSLCSLREKKTGVPDLSIPSSSGWPLFGR